MPRLNRLPVVLVVLIAIHSIGIGIALIVVPLEMFSAFGWEPSCDSFFFHQVGVFHIVLGAVYLIEYFRYGRVWTILIAKLSATLFLAVEYTLGTQHTAILLAGLGDGAIALIVILCFRRLLWSR